MNFSPFKYTAYCINKGGQFTPWKPILIKGLHAIIKPAIEQKNDCYSMVYNYATEDISSEYKVGDLHFDFDCENNIEQAGIDCLNVAERLNNLYQLSYEQMQVGFSGKKGFYLIVPKESFMACNASSLQTVFLVMLRVIADKEQTLDYGIYIKRRMWRINNTIHSSSGLFKINLTIEQLRSLTIEEIKKLAEKQNFIEVQRPDKPNKLLASLYEKSCQIANYELQKENQTKSKYDTRTSTPRGNISLDTLPSGYRYLARGATEGGINKNREGIGRNYNLCKLVGCLSTIGCNDSTIFDIAREFNNRCNPPKEWSVVERQVQALLKGGGI